MPISSVSPAAKRSQDQLSRFPPELLAQICETIFAHLISPLTKRCSLDPLPGNPHLLAEMNIPPSALPSSYPSPTWPQSVVLATLLALTRSSGALRAAALPYLFHSLYITYPRSWLALLSIICGPEFEGQDPNAEVDDDTDQAILDAQIAIAAEAAFSTHARRTRSRSREDTLRMEALQRSIMTALANSPFHSIPPELLSPPDTRDPSPADFPRRGLPSPSKIRSPPRSPSRWRTVRRVSDAVQDVMRDSGVYVPSAGDTRPPTYVHDLTFTHFRTIHMRPSYSSSSSEHGRFVTPFRLLRLLHELPSLRTFGATEYMDSALEINVLEELLLRGLGRHNSVEDERRGRERGRSHQRMADENEEERKSREDKEQNERRAECAALEALDLCGCVSSVLARALELFVERHCGRPFSSIHSGETSAMPSSGGDGDRPVQRLDLPLSRLGLAGVISIRPAILEPFVLSFPNLTMLDLSGTSCTPSLLSQLSQSPSMRLLALSIARCPQLTSVSVVDFLVASVCSKLEHLSLYGDFSFPSPLSETGVSTLLSSSLFTTGQFRYLDLSSAPVTEEHLQVVKPQPALRSLGLSYIPHLSLAAIAKFLLDLAPNVEILTLPNTSPELALTLPNREISLALHSKLIRPLCSSPFSITSPGKPAPTRLRVVDLSSQTLTSLAHGAPPWRIIRSRGGRGWYVDVSAAWINGQFRRDLPENNEWRRQLEEWADAKGNVGTGVGWHGRKMEVLRGEGMLGRSDGLYGVMSYAYAG